MATSSFYNDNLYRAYPFVAEGEPAIPNEWLVGLKINFNFGGGFSHFPSVVLTDWLSSGSDFVLIFSCEDATGKKVARQVKVPSALLPFKRVVSDLGDIQFSLIVGNLPPAGAEKTGLNLRVEPTRILWLQHRGIASVQVGNRARNVVALPVGSEYDTYGEVEWWRQSVKEVSRIKGPLLFSPGFNCRVYARAGNRLQVDAVPGGGLGEVQEDISKGCIDLLGKIVCEETPEDHPFRKDGLLDEGQVLYAFCGAVGPHIRMTATSTVRLTAQLEDNTITIGVGNLGGRPCE